METLLALCARAEGDEIDRHRLGRHAEALTPAEWTALPAQAERHGLGPLVYAHLQAAGAPVPAPVRRQLQGLAARHRHANRVRARVLRTILDAFEVDGIPSLVLKGGALAHTVYPDPGLRPMSDLDLLVPSRALGRAQRVLAALGFAVAPATGATPAHRHLREATRRVEGLRVVVELHHKLRSDYFDYARAYVRSLLGRRGPGGAPGSGGDFEGLHLVGPPRPFDLDGRPARTLSLEDTLGHLCWHLTSHVNVWDFARLIWVADVVGLVEGYGDAIDWARVRTAYPAVLPTLALLHAATPLSAPVARRAGIPPRRPPQGVGRAYRGWPRARPLSRQVLHETLHPPEWWLCLRYPRASARSLLWCRWVRHPLYILGHVLRVGLEGVGWPGLGDMARQEISE
jgi:hypothetical protein